MTLGDDSDNIVYKNGVLNKDPHFANFFFLSFNNGRRGEVCSRVTLNVIGTESMSGVGERG